MIHSGTYLPGLNGLRALSATAVVLSHIKLSDYNVSSLGYEPDFADIANFSVTVFFTLSGFLITFLLLTERKKQEINTVHFYLRRILRIWPLYFLYLTIAVIICIVNGNTVTWGQLFYYVFLIPNLVPVSIPFLYHFWSLGIEEQFYLMWPWIIKRANPVISCLIFIGIILLIKILARLVEYVTDDDALYKIAYRARFDCMAIGALGGILFFNKNQKFILYSSHNSLQIISCIIMGLALLGKFHVFSIIDHEIISCVTVCLIMGQIANENVFFRLENRLMNFVGRISFGIYIYHTLTHFIVVRILKHIEIPSLLKVALVYSLNLVIVILVAFVSYELFEKHILKLRSRYA